MEEPLEENFGFKIGDRVRPVGSHDKDDSGTVVAFSKQVEGYGMWNLSDVYYTHKSNSNDSIPDNADREFDYSKGWMCRQSNMLEKVSRWWGV